MGSRALLVAGCLLAGSTACAPTGPPARPAVVVITLDTTRADHLSVYGYERATTPQLEALARGGVIFERAYTTMPTTDPAHVSILTGLYPRRHGVTRNGQRAIPGLVSLPATMAAAGIPTAAFVSRGHLDPRELGVEGFDVVDGPAGDGERPAAVTAHAAIAWLKGREHGPYFLWVHFFDPHAPYDPRPPCRTRFGEGSGERRLGSSGWLPVGVVHPPDVVRNNARLYDGEIACMDEWVGRVVAAASHGRDAPPLVVIVADHGESLDDLERSHGYAYAHGEFLYDHQARVPLLMHWPDHIPAGRVTDALVQSSDLPPTIMDLVGLPQPVGLDGVSRADVVRGLTNEGADAVFIQRRSFRVPEQPFLAAEEYAVVAGWRKLIVNALKPAELYDLRADPGEVTNLARVDRTAVRTLRVRIDKWLAETPAARAEGGVSARTLRDLRALGYVD